MNTDSRNEFRVRRRRFSDLTTEELYALLMLRQNVFVVEQSCLYTDIDNKDQTASHLLAVDTRDCLVGCCRIHLPNEQHSEAVISRVVTAADVRGRKLGHRLIREATDFCKSQAPRSAVRLAAQSHLIGFYQQHGFQPAGAEYIEDGIPHVDMIRPIGSSD